MQKIILAVIIIVVLAAGSFLLIGRDEQKVLKTSNIQGSLPLYIQDVPLSVEVVETYSSRLKGLSGKPFLPDGVGMLFVFNDDELHGIWMKDMLFPIDIIWIDSNFKIGDFKEGATPESFPDVFKPIKKSRYVLEVNAGFVEKYSIKIGGSIRFDVPL